MLPAQPRSDASHATEQAQEQAALQLRELGHAGQHTQHLSQHLFWCLLSNRGKIGPDQVCVGRPSGLGRPGPGWDNRSFECPSSDWDGPAAGWVVPALGLGCPTWLGCPSSAGLSHLVGLSQFG